MDTVLRFSWDGVSITQLQGQVRPEITLTKAGPAPGTLLDIILSGTTVDPQDEDDVKNAMLLLGWSFVAKNPPSL